MRFSLLELDQDTFLQCPRAGCDHVIQGRPGARCVMHGVHLVTPDLVNAHPLLDRYQPIRRLAEGGFATVHLAIDLRAHPRERWVVVKRLTEEHRKPERHASRLRFRTEGELLGDFAHLPGVVDLIEAPYVGHEQLLVLDFVDGLSITQCMARLGGHLEHDKASRVILSLLVILSEVHRQGVVHRDIKPANVMLTELAETPGEPTRICLLDFGIAKRLRGPMRETVAITQQGMLLGTMCYMSPEQRAGRPADPRSDVYSVGASFFHMLAGYPPFQGTPIEIAHLPQDAPRLPLPADRFIPQQIVQVLDRAMAPEPADRYASADEMLHDLANAIAEPVPTLQSAAPLRPGNAAALVDPITADDDPPADGAQPGTRDAPTILTDGILAGDVEPEVPPGPQVVAQPTVGGAAVLIAGHSAARVALCAAVAFIVATAGAALTTSGPVDTPRLLQSASNAPPAMPDRPPRPPTAPAARQWVDYAVAAAPVRVVEPPSRPVRPRPRPDRPKPGTTRPPKRPQKRPLPK